MEDSQVIDSAYGENGQNGYKCGIEVHGVSTGVARACLGLLFFLEDSTLLSSVDLALLLLTTVVDGFVVYLFVLQRLFLRFLFLSLYFLLSVTTGIAWCVTLFKISFVGDRDFFLIAYDLSSVFLLLSVVELSLRITRTKLRPWKIIMWGIPLAVDCFIVALLTDARVIMLFLHRPSEGVLFMCGFAVVLLWVWKLGKKPVDGIAARFVNVLAVYFLLFFLVFWARETSSSSAAAALDNLSWMTGAWLPLGCGFALVSQERTLRV